MSRILVGCDPEMFLHDGYEFISAFGLIPGTKEEPHRIEKGTIQVDGTALEIGIHPASTPEEFSSNLDTVLAQAAEMVKAVSPDLRMRFTPIAHFDPTYFTVLPAQCKQLGCDPDFNILGQPNEVDESLIDQPMRTAAGHIHLGFDTDRDINDPEHFSKCRDIAAATARLPGFYPITKEERERIKYYGAPGAFRPKSYGVELRGPSNLWVEQPESRKKIFGTVVRKYQELFD